MHISRSCVVFAKTIELNAERFIPMDSAALFRTDLYRVPPKKICSLFLSLPFFFLGLDSIVAFHAFVFVWSDQKNCVGSSVDADQIFVFFSLIFLFWFPLRARIFHHPIFTFLSLSLSLTLSSSYLLHPTSTILLPPAPFHPSAPYIKYNKTSKILNKINNN